MSLDSFLLGCALGAALALAYSVYKIEKRIRHFALSTNYKINKLRENVNFELEKINQDIIRIGAKLYKIEGKITQNRAEKKDGNSRHKID